eukprot:1136438-Pelagomonas_calceolata.AAC.1
MALDSQLVALTRRYGGEKRPLTFLKAYEWVKAASEPHMASASICQDSSKSQYLGHKDVFDMQALKNACGKHGWLNGTAWEGPGGRDDQDTAIHSKTATREQAAEAAGGGCLEQKGEAAEAASGGCLEQKGEAAEAAS